MCINSNNNDDDRTQRSFFFLQPHRSAGKEEKCTELIQGCIPHRSVLLLLLLCCSAHRHHQHHHHDHTLFMCSLCEFKRCWLKNWLLLAVPVLCVCSVHCAELSRERRARAKNAQHSVRNLKI